jgi:ribosomal protein S21
MNKHLHDTVLAVATDVRYWAEGRARPEDSDLNGWCAKASAQLFRELQEEGIPAEIHMWAWHNDESAHVFVVVEDHVVDVTATQFRQFVNKPVVIMHKREAEAYEFYRTERVFADADELRKHQKKTRWPAEQVAYEVKMR